MIEFEDIDFRYINAEFIVTNCCNLCCDYCFERQYISDHTKFGVLSFEDMCGYMDLIIQNRIARKIPYSLPSCINFFGGEPMLQWNNIVRLMEKYSEYKFFHYSIITNGLLITKERLQRVKKFPILWQISLDSAVPVGNIYRFKDKSTECTNHVLQVIEWILEEGFETPIVSSVIHDKSVKSMVETYHYFAERRLPIKWQCMIERLGDQTGILEEYNRQNLEILDLLVKNPFNIPMMWQNVIWYYQISKTRESVSYEPTLTESPSPNNLYVVAPNGKLYLSTNNVDMLDETPETTSIGELPNGVDKELVRNHPYLKALNKEISPKCLDCPSFAVNPCCFEQNFFLYPRQFLGNCNVFLSSTYYALEFLRRRGEL